MGRVVGCPRPVRATCPPARPTADRCWSTEGCPVWPNSASGTWVLDALLRVRDGSGFIPMIEVLRLVDRRQKTTGVENRCQSLRRRTRRTSCRRRSEPPVSRTHSWSLFSKSSSRWSCPRWIVGSKLTTTSGYCFRVMRRFNAPLLLWYIFGRSLAKAQKAPLMGAV